MEGENKIDELLELLEQELILTFSRSSGPGGQHVNKVSTRVDLKFPVNDSAWLSEAQKTRIKRKLKSRITSEGVLVLSSQEERSQRKNRQLVIEKFRELIGWALRPEKKRIATKPSFRSIEARLTDKKKTSRKKQVRKRPGTEDTL